MNYKKLNGSLFKIMLTNGAINLRNAKNDIDALNVFPVPDGDTGTNMSMTIMSGIRELNNNQSNSLEDLAKSFSRGLLMGARGNSGVILSQFFRGFFTGIEELSGKDVRAKELINCLVYAYKGAYRAVMDPVEGTILTVVKMAALAVLEKEARYITLNEVFNDYLAAAKKALDNTPNLLPALKEAGVIDSGGAGFVKVIEGMILALDGVVLEVDHQDETKTTSYEASAFNTTDSIKYGYCTEFILELKQDIDFDDRDLRQPLSIIGDSIVFVHDDNIVKVHVHTNIPGRALNLAQRFGEFKTVKIENMRLQHSEIVNGAVANQKDKYAVIVVAQGDGVKQAFTDLGATKIIDGGQTMNPSTEDFVKAIDEANAENIIILPNNKNVILSAEQASNLRSSKNVQVIRSKTIPQGYSALSAFDKQEELEDNLEGMNVALENVKALEVTYAIRDTKIGGIVIKNGDYMGLLNGKIDTVDKSRLVATKKLLEKAIDDMSIIVTIFKGMDADDKETKELENYIVELNSEIEVDVKNGGQNIYTYLISVE